MKTIPINSLKELLKAALLALRKVNTDHRWSKRQDLGIYVGKSK